ncbi:MAG: hypothetical protein HC874_27555 [Richelia sp. SL_2_1]|nr:hypothetical protein [Richelia sp. SL_2_1]
MSSSFIGLTPYQIEELMKCYNDPIYFIENYGWIEVKEMGLIIPAVLYDYQKTILRWLVNKESGVVLKSRRVGGSTVVALYLAWLINFRRGINALLLSRTEDNAKKLLNKVKFSFFNIKKHTSDDYSLAEDASWMLNTIAVNNQQLFATGWLDDEGNITGMSEVASLTTTSESGRSESATFVFMDEMAFIQDQEGASRASRITTTRGGHWLAVSCQTPDVYVFTDNGIQQLGDFINRDSKVGAFSSINTTNILGSNGLQNCELTYNNGLCDTLRVITELNYQIECSLEHPILVNRYGKIAWCRAENLQIGDWTPINRNNNCFGQTKIEHPYLLGLILGDGYIYEPTKKITMTSIDEELHQFLEMTYGFIRQKDNIHSCKTLSNIVNYYESIGYKFVTAKYKEIPYVVLLSDKESQKLVLRGLFDTDGCSTPDGRVSYVSTSERMIDQIRMMLLNFGITSAKYHKVSKPTERVKVESEQWILEIGLDAWIFFDVIGFGLTRKQNNYKPSKQKSLKDIIPFGAVLANIIMSDSSWCKDVSLRNRRKQLRHSNRNKNILKEHQPISYQSAKDVLYYFSDKSYLSEYKKLSDLVDKNYRWVKITKLEDSYNETWDFSIPQDRSYISNGLISHQTPNGVGDSFHSLCMRAERGENRSYNYLKVHWSEAGMTDKMIDSATEGLSEASRLQEMEMEFLSSGDPVFHHTHLAACFRPIDEYPEIELDIARYREQVVSSKGDLYYFSGVDTAVGKLNKRDSKRDYHCFTTLTKSGIQAYTYYTKEESLTDWAGNIEQLPNGNSIKRNGTVSQLHSEYPGLLQIEINGPGQTVYINHQLPSDGFSVAIPKQTTFKSKDQIIRQLVLAVEAHAIVITDRFTYQCMSIFQRGSTPGTYSAPTGDYYDDPVIAIALAWDALLQTGAIEFTWGADTDRLVKSEVSNERIEEIDTAKLGYGPAVINKAIDANERASSYFGDALTILDDMDMSKIVEPEF